MFNRFSLLTSILVYLAITSNCFSSDSVALQESKQVIIDQIKSKNFDTAETLTSDLTKDYSEDTGLPVALRQIATRFYWSDELSRAKNVYQEIISCNQSSSKLKERASFEIDHIDIHQKILNGDFAGAESDTASLTANLSNIKAGPKDWLDTIRVLIANRFKSQGQTITARNMYQDVLENPAVSGGYRHQIAGVKFNYYNALDALRVDNFALAEDIAATIKADYNIDKEITKYMILLADRCAKRERLSAARNILAGCCDTSRHPDLAEKVSLNRDKFDILELIYSREFDSAETAIAQFKSNYESHPSLVYNLHQIALKFYWSDELSRAKNVYQEIISCNQSSSKLKERASFEIDHIDIHQKILNGDFAGAESDTASLTANLSNIKAGPKDWLDTIRVLIANRFKSQGQRITARNMYQDVLENPAVSGGYRHQIAGVKFNYYNALDALRVGNFALAEDIAATIKADYNIDKEITKYMILLADRCANRERLSAARNILAGCCDTSRHPDLAEKVSLNRDKFDILELIYSREFDSADTAISQFKSNYKSYPSLVYNLHQIAIRYEQEVKDRQQVRTIHQSLGCQGYLQLDIRRLDVFDLIDSGDYTRAESAIDGICSDFSNQKYMPEVLTNIAEYWEKAGEYEKAGSVYTRIGRDYNSLCPRKTDDIDMHLYRLGLMKNALAGNKTQVSAAVNNMLASTEDRSAAVNQINRAALKAERMGKADMARYIFSENKSRSEYAGLRLKSMDIIELIESGDYDQAEIEITNLQQNYADNPHTTEQLLQIAEKLEKSGFINRASELYVKLEKDYPSDNLTARRKALGIRIRDLASSGNKAELKDSVNTLLGGSFHPEEFKGWLYNLGRDIQRRGHLESALKVFSQISRDGGDSDVEVYSKAYKLLIENKIWQQVESDFGTGVNSGKTLLESRFTDTEQRRLAIYAFAEGLYEKLEGSNFEDKTFSANLNSVIGMFEVDVLSGLTRNDIESEVYFILGQLYERAGDYESSVSYYQSLLDKYPDYSYSWYAQFMIGRNYEQMLEESIISKAKANEQITAAYTRLLKDYPNCKAAKAAKSWLKKN